MIVATLVSLILFIAYLAVFFVVFRQIPTSLSDSYYHYEGLCKGAGIAFVIAMFLVAISLAPALFIASEGHPLQFLGFFTAAGLCFVGAAPKFREVGMESIIHPIAAFVCATGCVLWIVFIAQMWWTLIITLAIFSLLAITTKTLRCYLFWLEMVAFFSIFWTLLMM